MAIEIFEDRLKNKPINENLSNKMKKTKDDLCNLRFKFTKNNKTPDWTMKELNLVLKQLKNNKSRDPFGYINELFNPIPHGGYFSLHSTGGGQFDPHLLNSF